MLSGNWDIRPQVAKVLLVSLRAAVNGSALLLGGISLYSNVGGLLCLFFHEVVDGVVFVLYALGFLCLLMLKRF